MGSQRRFLIISGLSGAGKSIALHALEDAGFYCVDNLPVGVLPMFARFVEEQNSPHFTNVAVGIDARNHPDAIESLPDAIIELRQGNLGVELLFIDASEQTLLKRFSETRRKHPLSTGTIPLAEAIGRERELLDAIAEHADIRLDTTTTNVHEFRAAFRDLVTERDPAALALQFRSFGFKHGVPSDADYVFDVRCLPNPYWEPGLRDLSGRDAEVREFLDGHGMVTDMFNDVVRFLEVWVSEFDKLNRSYLTVAFGCTGGRHRSVYMAERIARHFGDSGRQATVSHRDGL